MKSEIELFRVVSIFGIVWFHSGIEAGKDIAYGGLIFFIIISAYFATISLRRHSLLYRMERLIIPCVLWSFFYGAVKFVDSGHIFPEKYGYLSMILSTPSIHLWFLPFIFLVNLTIDNLRYFLFKEWVAILVGIGAILAIIFTPIWRDLTFMPPFGQYAHAMPAVLIGIFLGVFYEIGYKTRTLILIGISCSILFMVFKQQQGIGIPYIVGLVPCIFLYYENTLTKTNKYLLVFSSSTFGVYLLHVFSLMILRYIGIAGYFLPIVAFVFSILLISIIRNFIPKNIVKYII